MSNSIKVKIGDEFYWFLPRDNDNRSGPIAPLEHCHEDGEFNIECFMEISFAYAEAGEVRRFREPIGHLDDFIEAAKTGGGA